MSVLETEQMNTETAERPFLVREFNAEITESDGRTIDVRIVPYGEAALVDDGEGAYREEFMRGAFDAQLAAAHRLKVWLKFQHERGIAAVVGKGVSFHEEDDGLHGSFRAIEHTDGDKALMLVREGMLDSVSLEFRPKKSIRTATGIVQRVKAHLDSVALCREGAYTSAKVLAVRQAPEEIVDEALLPVDMDPELVERCRRLGIALPQRYTAHPAETDTSAGTDTSEDGTRQPENTPNSEE